MINSHSNLFNLYHHHPNIPSISNLIIQMSIFFSYLYSSNHSMFYSYYVHYSCNSLFLYHSITFYPNSHIPYSNHYYIPSIIDCCTHCIIISSLIIALYYIFINHFNYIFTIDSDYKPIIDLDSIIELEYKLIIDSSNRLIIDSYSNSIIDSYSYSNSITDSINHYYFLSIYNPFLC